MIHDLVVALGFALLMLGLEFLIKDSLNKRRKK